MKGGSLQAIEVCQIIVGVSAMNEAARIAVCLLYTSDAADEPLAPRHQRGVRSRQCAVRLPDRQSLCVSHVGNPRGLVHGTDPHDDLANLDGLE